MLDWWLAYAEGCVEAVGWSVMVQNYTFVVALTIRMVVMMMDRLILWTIFSYARNCKKEVKIIL